MPSLFNRATFKAATLSDEEGSDDEPKDIFNHSARSYDALIAEEERKRLERVERHKVKAERRDASKAKKRNSDEVKREASTGPPKRRRINGDETAKLLSSVGLGTSKTACSPSPGHEKDGEPSPLRRSPRKSKTGSETIVTRSSNQDADVIELGDSSEPEDAVPRQPSPPKPVEDDVEEESDEELAALARQARARKTQEQDKASSTPEAGMKSLTPLAGGFDASYGGLASANHDPDPAIKLFISSPIPDTRPIVIVRRMSQRLQEVRVGWCKKMDFKDDLIERVFLIHRMRRFYDMTTVRSLGLSVEADGQVTLKGAAGKEGVDQLHLEAVTQELFDKMKDDQAKEALKRSGQWDPAAEAGAEEEAAAAAKKQDNDTLIKVVLKAKNRDDFKLKVKPVSAISLVEFHLLHVLTSRNRQPPSPRSLPLAERTSAYQMANRYISSSMAIHSSKTRRCKARTSQTWTSWRCILADESLCQRDVPLASACYHFHRYGRRCSLIPDC